jgi:hypothetical protein
MRELSIPFYPIHLILLQDMVVDKKVAWDPEAWEQID